MRSAITARLPKPIGSLSKPRAVKRSILADAYRHAFLLLTPLILLYLFLLDSGGSEDFFRQINSVTPVCLILILMIVVYRILRRLPDAIWTPAIWLPLQSAVFFGFGPLVEIYGNDTTLSSLAGHKLAITQADLLRANTLSTIGIWLVFFGFWAHNLMNGKAWARVLRGRLTTKNPIVPPEIVALGFVFAGAVLKYGVVKPTDWGMINLIIPGVLTSLGSIVDVGFALMAFLGARGHKRMRFILLVLLPLHLALSSLSFSKMEIIMALILPAIGAYMGHQRPSRLVVSFVIIAFVFMLAQPFVAAGRAVIVSRTSTITQADYIERAQIAFDIAFEQKPAVSDVEESQGWWTRLNFSGVQTFAMQAHDQGIYGNSLKDAWMLFIPRVMWPGKPIIVGPGAEFYSLVTGREGISFLALSVYGDLYWQFGWWGLILICPLIGYLFSMVSIRSLRTIASREFILFPAVLIGMEMSILGLNKFLVNGIIGVIPIYVAYVIFAGLVVRILPLFRKHAGKFKVS